MQRREDIAQPGPEAVRDALKKITGYSGFATAERMRRFLNFVVNKTLAGTPEILKEYLLGVEVFDRGPGFDPRIDTIVRVEARRLRKKLLEYYRGEGQFDPVLITLPSGSYIPVFELRSVPTPPPSATVPLPRPLILWALIVILSALVAGALLLRQRIGRANQPATAASVAVLPFVDMSFSKDQQYLCDGISEELINALSAIPTLKVAARTSAFRYKGKADDIRRIGADLGVENIIEGSIRTSGPRIRVTAQLIRVRDGYYLWSREFDRDFTEVFSVQEELARAVASSVGTEIATGISLDRPQDPEAYRLYLEGRHYWRQFLPASTAQAVTYFRRATEADPSFAPAYAGLGDSYMQMNVWGMAPPDRLMEQARQAAMRALSLQPNSAEAEATLGAVSAFYDWDWKSCEQHFRRSIDAQASYVNAHWLHATTCLGPQGRLDEALAEAHRAVVLDPLSPLTETMLGEVHFYRREFDAALVALDEALRLDPSFAMASLFKVFVYLAQGRTELAATNDDLGLFRAYIATMRGDAAGAQEQIDRMRRGAVNPLAIAAGYAGLGQQENALYWLERAADARIPQMIWIHFQTPYQSLHGTARYRAIQARMRLP